MTALAFFISYCKPGIKGSASTTCYGTASVFLCVWWKAFKTDFDQIATVQYGLIRASLEARGRPIGAMDMLLAAQARSRDLVLVTNNEKEFRRVEQLEIENWISG